MIVGSPVVHKYARLVGPLGEDCMNIGIIGSEPMPAREARTVLSGLW
jgi:hypothetical protein